MKLTMLENVADRFDRMSLRERALISFALLAAVVMIWDAAFMRPLNAQRISQSAELESVEKSIATTASVAEAVSGSDPTSLANDRERAVQASLDAVNEQLVSASSGLIAPQRMIEVIHDVLSRQHDLKLVSLHNEPVTSLLSTDEMGTDKKGGVESAPYIHPVELVVEGRYLDVLEYIRELEALPWRFRWKVLELQTTEYPINRVRIELSTMSLDKAWLGV